MTSKKRRTFREKMRLIGACQEARDWCGDRTGQQAWDECKNPDWLFWLLAAAMPGNAPLSVRRKIVRLACDVARPALAFVPRGEDRPKAAIDAAERWAKGERVSIEELEAARVAAARAAGDAAAGDAAARVAARAAVAAARAATRKEQCELIRKWFPKCPTIKVK